MIKYRSLCSLIALVCILTGIATAAEDVKKPETYAQVVIEKAISFMPSDQKSKLTDVKTDILAVFKPDQTPATEPTYFVSKEEGTGPDILADRFHIVRKAVAKNTSYSKMAPDLGKLAVYVIALCQPYHTDETAFKGTAHAAFEKELDTSSASLTASFDEFQKVENPSEFGIKIAKSANEQLKKLTAAESPDAAGVRSAVFKLAVNSVADCWHTLLTKQEIETQQDNETTQNIEPTQNDGTWRYIGNKNSLKFHLPTCRYLPAEKNRIYLKTRDEAISNGFVPCKLCKP